MNADWEEYFRETFRIHDVPERKSSGLIRYFEPQYAVGVDPYGSETLPGGLGSVIVGGKESEITQMFRGKDGHTTLTLSPVAEYIHRPPVDADYWPKMIDPYAPQHKSF